MNRDDRRSPRETYDRIARHFSQTREYPWPEVETFVERAVERVASVDVALDVGCGNGRHAAVLGGVADRAVGVDASAGLLREARRRAAERGYSVDLVHADAGSLPLDADVADLAVYVATVHHLRPRARRVASFDELARVLTPEGRGLVSAWSTAHDRFDRETGFDTTVDWTLPGGERVPRYYHIYDPGEFETDLADSSLVVHDVRVSSGNCYAVVGGRER